MNTLQKFFFVIFIVLVIAFIIATAYIISPDVRNLIDGSGIGPMIGGWGQGIGLGITASPFWQTYIAPPINSYLIFGVGMLVVGALFYRYVYEKGIREKAIRDAWDSRGASGIATSQPSVQTPINATNRLATSTQQVTQTPVAEVPTAPPPEEKKQ